MFLKMSDYNNINIGMCSNLTEEYCVIKNMHRYVIDDLGNHVGAIMCTQHIESPQHGRNCPLCERYFKIFGEYKARNVNSREELHAIEAGKSKQYTSAIIYNYNTKKHQILIFGLEILNGLRRLERIHGDITKLVVEINNNKRIDPVSKKYYEVRKAEKEVTHSIERISDTVLQGFNKLTSPLSYEDMIEKVSGEIKIRYSKNDY